MLPTEEKKPSCNDINIPAKEIQRHANQITSKHNSLNCMHVELNRFSNSNTLLFPFTLKLYKTQIHNGCMQQTAMLSASFNFF